jgi:epoxyqueuosine reductase
LDFKSTHTELIKNEAKRLGFLSCGISKADFLEEEAPRLEQWLNKICMAKCSIWKIISING